VLTIFGKLIAIGLNDVFVHHQVDHQLTFTPLSNKDLLSLLIIESESNSITATAAAK
jgi:hypothetical protein